MIIGSKLKIKVDATSTHYEGWGRDALLCVEPVGEIEMDFPNATHKNQGFMSSQDKIKLDNIESEYKKYTDGKVQDIKKDISSIYCIISDSEIDEMF